MIATNFKKAFGYLGLAAPLLIGLACAYAAAGLLTLGPSPAPQSLGEEQPVETRTVSQVRKEIILDRNILGLARSTPPEDGESGRESSPSPSGGPNDWPLIGVVMGRPDSAAIVVVDGQAEILLMGQQMAGWTLIQVMWDQVVWEKNNNQIIVKISTEPVQVKRERPSAKASVEPAPVVRSKAFSDKASIDKEYARQLLEKPSILLEQAQYKPYKQNGEVVGFVIRSIDKGSVLEKVGMENEDVLVRLNGRDIKDPASLMQAYAGLQGSNTISMDLLRNGETKSILLELE